MKFLLLTLFLMTACSKSPNSTQDPLARIPQAEIEMAPSTINLTVVDSVLTGALSNLETEIALGDVEVGTKISKRIILSAKTEIPVLNIDGFRNASTFLFKYSNCSTFLKRLRSCVIDIEFTPAVPGPLSEIIALSPDLSFQLTANITAKPIVVPTYPNLLVPESLSLGDFVGIKKTARVTISNKSSVPQELIPDFSALSGTNFTYVSYCPVAPVKLLANRSCQIDFSYLSTEELSADQVFSVTASMNSKPMAISVTHKATVQVQDEGFAWLTPAIVLGDLSTTRKQIVYVKNGTSKDQTNLAFSTLPNGVSVLRTNCYASLRISRSCYVELQFSPTQMYDGAFAYQYDYSNSTILARLNITANVIGGISSSVPCTLADAESNRWDITNASLASGNKVGTNVSACMVASCNQNFSPDSFNKVCVPNVIACANGVGSGTQTWNGSAYDACVVDACPANYEILANACSPIACTLSNAGGYGVTLNHVTTVIGVIPNCAVSACDEGYSISQDAKSCTLSSSMFMKYNGFNGGSNAVVTQADGKKIYGGEFTSFTNSAGVTFVTNRIARINVDGSLDEAFASNVGSGFDANVYALALDSSGNLYVGGQFTTFKGVANSAKNIAKLSSSGVLDTTFMNNLDAVSGTKATTSGFNNIVFALTIDSSNNLYVGGSFTSFKGGTNNANRIAKLSSSGVLDTTFMDNLDAVSGTKATTSGFDVIVRALTVDSSNNLYVGGNFTAFKGLTNSARYVAKLSSSGVLDTTFMNNLDAVSGTKSTSSGFDSNVLSLTIDSSNNLYVGGQFTTFKGVTSSANRIAKLSSSGVLDTTFMNNLDAVSGTKATTSGFNATVNALTVDSTGNLYVGGQFTSLKGIANSARYIAKLSSSGVLDSTFMDNLDVVSGTKATSSGFNSFVYSFDLDISSNLYVGGAFTSFKNTSANYNLKLSSTGVTLPHLPSSSAFNSIVRSIVVDSYGNTYVGGDFISYNGVTTNKLAKFDPSGNLDVAFSAETGAGFDGNVLALTVDSAGNLYVGGLFTSFKGIANSARYIAKLSSSGVLDTTFMDNLDVVSGTKATTSGFSSDVRALTVDSAGNLYVGGSFTSFKGGTNNANRIAKLSSSGVLDTTFMDNLDVVSGTKATTSGFNNIVYALTVDSSNNLYVGGNFTAFKGLTNSARYVAKLSSSGVLDTTFISNLDVVPGTRSSTSGFNTTVNTLTVDSSNNLYVGGNFTAFKGGTNNANRIAKLSSSGVFDTTFSNNLDVVPGTKTTTSGFNATVNTLTVDSAGNLYVGGNFANFKGVTNSANFIAKLSSSGVLDTTFMNNLDVVSGTKTITSGFNNNVNSLTLDSAGNLYVGGTFTLFKGVTNSRILLLLDDGTEP